MLPGAVGAIMFNWEAGKQKEIAVNQGRADRELGLAIGTPVEIVE